MRRKTIRELSLQLWDSPSLCRVTWQDYEKHPNHHRNTVGRPQRLFKQQNRLTLAVSIYGTNAVMNEGTEWFPRKLLEFKQHVQRFSRRFPVQFAQHFGEHRHLFTFLACSWVNSAEILYMATSDASYSSQIARTTASYWRRSRPTPEVKLPATISMLALSACSNATLQKTRHAVRCAEPS